MSTFQVISILKMSCTQKQLKWGLFGIFTIFYNFFQNFQSKKFPKNSKLQEIRSKLKFFNSKPPAALTQPTPPD